MLDTVAGAGYAKFPGYEFPKLQILTLKEFFSGKQLKLPSTNITFKAAQHTGKRKENQEALEL
jgi:site-specific DNA-methyltransferase (adenine-specific)